MRRNLTILAIAAIFTTSCKKDIIDSGSSSKQLQQLSAVDKNISVKLQSGKFSGLDLKNYIKEKQEISYELKASGITAGEVKSAIVLSR